MRALPPSWLLREGKGRDLGWTPRPSVPFQRIGDGGGKPRRSFLPSFLSRYVLRQMGVGERERENTASGPSVGGGGGSHLSFATGQGRGSHLFVGDGACTMLLLRGSLVASLPALSGLLEGPFDLWVRCRRQRSLTHPPISPPPSGWPRPPAPRLEGVTPSAPHTTLHL